MLKVQSPVVEDGSSVALSTKTDSIGEYFRFERIGNENQYIITTKSSGYTCALAYNSNTESIYQTNTINTQVLLKFRIREGGCSMLPSGYYCLGNPFITTSFSPEYYYFYLSERIDYQNGYSFYYPSLDYFSRNKTFPKWFMNYNGNGYYEIIAVNDNQFARWLTYSSGVLQLTSFSGDDSQLWRCSANNDFSHRFQAKGTSYYLSRDPNNAFITHDAVAIDSPISKESDWKATRFMCDDDLYNYGNIADVLLVGIEDYSHYLSSLTWMGKSTNDLFDKSNNYIPINYESFIVEYVFDSPINSNHYLEIINQSKFIIHFGHGIFDDDQSKLILNPINDHGVEIGTETRLSTSMLNSINMSKCDCALFLACHTAGETDLDFNSSLVKKSVDQGASYAVGIQGIGYTNEIIIFINHFISCIQLSNNSASSPNYKAAFLSVINNPSNQFDSFFVGYEDD